MSAIHKLPEIDEITLDDEEQILEAKALYDSKDDQIKLEHASPWL